MIDKEATHIGVGVYKNFWVQIFAKNPNQKYTLTVYANGGTFPSKGGVEKFEMSVPARMEVPISTIPLPVKDGSTFQKWTAITATSGIEEGASKFVAMYDNRTLKANWTGNDSSN